MRRWRSLFLSCIYTLFALFSSTLAYAAPQQPRVHNSTSTAAFAKYVLQQLAPSEFAVGQENGLTVIQLADLATAFAEYDHLSGERSFQNVSVALFNDFQSQYSNYTMLNSETARWGLAAYRIYRAYGNHSFLDASVGIWNQLHASFIPNGGADVGNTPPLGSSTSCDNKSIQGAVLLSMTNASVNADVIGPFIILSSHLYNETRNETYSSAAALSIEFFKEFLTDSAKPNALDSFDITSCNATGGGTPARSTGFYIESIALYVNVTGKFTNSTNRAYSNSFVNTSLELWTDRDNSSNISDHESIFMHGLYEYTTLKSSDPVIFDRVRNLINATHVNPAQRHPNASLSQSLAAAELLIVKLELEREPGDFTGTATSAPRPGPSATSGGSTPASGPTSASLMNSKPLGAIVGGILGGLTGASLVVGLIIFICRRHARRHAYYRPQPIQPLAHPEDAIDPFISPAPSRSISPPPTRRVLTADGSRVTKLQRERYAPDASEVYSTVIPPYSIRPDDEIQPRPLNVDPETLQRIYSSFQSIMARLQRREEALGRKGRNIPVVPDQKKPL